MAGLLAFYGNPEYRVVTIFHWLIQSYLSIFSDFPLWSSKRRAVLWFWLGYIQNKTIVSHYLSAILSLLQSALHSVHVYTLRCPPLWRISLNERHSKGFHYCCNRVLCLTCLLKSVILKMGAMKPKNIVHVVSWLPIFSGQIVVLANWLTEWLIICHICICHSYPFSENVKDTTSYGDSRYWNFKLLIYMRHVDQTLYILLLYSSWCHCLSSVNNSYCCFKDYFLPTSCQVQWSAL